MSLSYSFRLSRVFGPVYVGRDLGYVWSDCGCECSCAREGPSSCLSVLGGGGITYPRQVCPYIMSDIPEILLGVAVLAWCRCSSMGGAGNYSHSFSVVLPDAEGIVHIHNNPSCELPPLRKDRSCFERLLTNGCEPLLRQLWRPTTAFCVTNNYACYNLALLCNFHVSILA